MISKEMKYQDNKYHVEPFTRKEETVGFSDSDKEYLSEGFVIVNVYGEPCYRNGLLFYFDEIRAQRMCYQLNLVCDGGILTNLA